MFSPLVAAELRAPGHDAVAIKEREEWQSLSDPEFIALARTEQRAVATTNLRDFRPLHAELVAPGGDGTLHRLRAIQRPADESRPGQHRRGAGGPTRAAPGDADLANGETWISAKLTGQSRPMIRRCPRRCAVD